MPLYRVPMVRSEHLEAWLEYHGDRKHSQRGIELARVGWFDQAEIIDAANAPTAKQKATAKRPGWVVVGKTDQIG